MYTKALQNSNQCKNQKYLHRRIESKMLKQKKEKKILFQKEDKNTKQTKIPKTK